MNISAVSPVCKGKVELETQVMGKCSKCRIQLKIKKCTKKQVVKVKIMRSDSGMKIIDATFFDEQLKKVLPKASDDNMTLMERLLNIDEAINVCINSKNIVTDVSFKQN